ncbi:uncharacterized protein LOC116947170 isoform X1 [Petromyzon marinus]|uniref:uncharacterized protein LOC116947170 isoform X1 n=1 Tax=Petromyzon marinus TaxID=7757 RepID=UPI003F7119F9
MGISKELQRDDAKVGGKGFKKLFSLRRAKKGREKQREEQAQVEEQVEEEEGEEEESGSRGLENSAFAPRDRELGGDAGQPGWQAVWADGFHGQGTPGGARARLGNIAALPDRYEQLVTNEEKEERRRMKKEKHKKYRKNVGRALRRGWTYFVTGLTSATNFYVSPWAAASVIRTSR